MNNEHNCTEMCVVSSTRDCTMYNLGRLYVLVDDWLRIKLTIKSMASQQHVKVAQKLAAACRETAEQAIAATEASGQAQRVHHKNRKYGRRKEVG